MEVSYDDTKFEGLLNDQRALVRKYGVAAASRLARRITSIRTAENLADLLNLPGRTHGLKGSRSGQFASELSGSLRLIMAPTPPVPQLNDGGIDLTATTRITIVEIIDYH